MCKLTIKIRSALRRTLSNILEYFAKSRQQFQIPQMLDVYLRYSKIEYGSVT